MSVITFYTRVLHMLDMKLNKNERQDLETKENHNSEADIEMKENEAYCSIQI